jgi:O-antigen/teichoic acid export membrane protein
MEFIKNKYNQITKHAVVRNSMIVLIGSVSGNLLAYIYHLLVGRVLGPAKYGELGALLSMFYILNVPSGVIQTGLTKYFAVLKARNSPGQAKTLYLQSIKTLTVFGLIGFGVIFLLNRYLAIFLNINDPLVLILLYLVFYIFLITVPNASLFSGFQRFTEMTVIMNVSSVFRIVFGIIAAYFGVLWTVAANAMTNLSALLMGFWPIRDIISTKSVSLTVSKKRIIKYAIPMTVAMMGVTSFYSMDVVLVKHFFSSHDAGIYTALSVLGKIIFFASFAITSVMFPTIAERKEKGQDYSKLFWNGAMIVAVISVIVTTGYFMFPELTVRLLFGKSYDDATQYIGKFGLFLSLVTLATYFVQCFLAAGKTFIAIFVSVAAFAQIIMIYQFHNSLTDVINVNISVTLILCIVLALCQKFNFNKL